MIEQRKKINGKEVRNVIISISKFAKENGISWATAKKRLNGDYGRKKRTFKGRTILDSYKEIIDEKLEKFDCTGASIYYWIKKQGYDGSSSTVSNYVRNKKDDILKKATYRVEYTPGILSEVDWKEKMTLISKNGEAFTINIFLYILCFSKFKYIELTIDKTQSTLFSCLVNAFHYCGNKVPEEIWFDNMKTVVDSHDINTNEVKFNERFLEFAKNASFKPIACKPYRPCTKGIVENLAKIMDRLIIFNEEFEDYDELNKIVKTLNDDLNNEVSQATNEKPIDSFLSKEKEYLNSINLDQFNYKSNLAVRKVDKSSMINYDNCKYSVQTEYIGCSCQLVFDPLVLI